MEENKVRITNKAEYKADNREVGNVGSLVSCQVSVIASGVTSGSPRLRLRGFDTNHGNLRP